MPRDFLEEDYKPASIKTQPRDFLEAEEPEESLGTAAFLAPFRVGEDVAKGAYNVFQNSPEYWGKAKTEVPGLLTNAFLHPIDRAKQSLAGLLELGQKINHSPKTIAQYAANRLHLIPEDWPNKIPVGEDLDPAIAQYLGSPQHPGDELTRGLLRNANLIAPGAEAANVLNPLNLSTKNIVKDVLKTRERNMANYGQRYENIWKEAENAGRGNLTNTTKNEIQIPLEKYETSNGFGISHNPNNYGKPTNNIEMVKNGNNARVIHSVIEDQHRGKGYGKLLYKEAIDESIKRGMGFESDSVVSPGAMKMYRSLENEGYKFEFNPDVKLVNTRFLGKPLKKFESIDGTSPVVKLVSKPSPKNAIKEEAGLGNLAHTSKKQTNFPFEKYEVGPLFGVKHNSGNSAFPTNTIDMRVEGNKAKVTSSRVEPEQRGKGIGKALYKEAIDDATKKGLQFESDNAVSNDALNIYKALEKEGYKFDFNRKAKSTLIKHHGEHYKGVKSLDEETPVVKLISKPPYKNNIYIDADTIKKYSPARGIKGLEDFENSPTLQNAHNAKSDLLRIKRDLDKQTTLRTAERQQLAAVNNGIDSINNNMFKDSNGRINEALKNKYENVQNGYRNEVVPYNNKAIKEYLRQESSPQELVNSLSKRAFYAKRGKYHNALRIRKLIKSHPYLAGLGAGSALGYGGNKLYEDIFGK